MKKQTTSNITIWASTLLLLLCSLTINAQDCFFTTSYEIIDIANNGDGTCDYTIDLCAEVDENAVVHTIEYSVLFDSDGDGDDESIVTYNFTPGIQIPNGSYCLSSSAPAQTFTITTPCGNDIMLVVTGVNNDTNEECMNLIEEIVLGTADDTDVAEVQNDDELLMPEISDNNSNNIIPTNFTQTAKAYSLYPSLAQNVINLELPTANEEQLDIFLTDMNGQILANFSLEAGDTKKQIAVDELNPGHYFVIPAKNNLGLNPKSFVKL